MFVRKITNRSGSVSVQIISKERGFYRVLKTFGSSKNPDEIARLHIAAQEYVTNPSGQHPLFSTLSKEDIAIKNFIKNTTNAQIRTIGPELIFGILFDRIGFGVVPDELFRHLVIARLAYPTSKLKTVDYLYRYKGITISVQTVYRFLDKLKRSYKEKVEQVAFEYTNKTLGGITVVFYDMTTLYFETEDEDDLRKIGFSKDGKFQCPQIMLGLLVGRGGFPIGYDIFEGNTFEGKTLIPVLQKIQEKYGLGKPIVVADAALLSKNNLGKLHEQEYQFIIGARIKNETDTIKGEILIKSQGMKDRDSFILRRKDDTKLIVTYSNKRAHKDAYNREKGLKKLRARVASGTLSKKHINNRGYNKFLTFEGEVKISIDEERAIADTRWDGLKGYVTNSDLPPKQVVEHYGHLWQIEQAFRISKTDLRVRPIYHYRKRRIEAHICIAFVAYTIYKELERSLNQHKTGISPKRAIALTHNMYELEYTLPHARHVEKAILKMDGEQQALYDCVHMKKAEQQRSP
jgi:transposase